MGRVKSGVTRDQAVADVQGLFAESVRESWAQRPADTPNPSRNAIPQLRIVAGSQGPDSTRLDALPMILAFFATVGAVLLLGCANLANLLLARALTRRQEVSVRLVLGATRWRLIRQMLIESALLAVVGGAAGALLAVWGKDFLTWLPSGNDTIVTTRIDLRVLAFTGGLSLMTTVLVSLGPALRATGADLGEGLRTSGQKGGAGRGLARKALMVAQLAICLVLLISAGLFARTVRNYGTVDVGFNADNLLVFRVAPRIDSRTLPLYDAMIAAIDAVPGVQSATLSALPLIANAEWEERVLADGAAAPREAFIQNIHWNFFDTMGIPLLAGRALVGADRDGAPRVAVINATMARQMFEAPNPIGRYFQFVDGQDRGVPIEVVGVVQDSKYSRLSQPMVPTLYLPQAQRPPSSMTVEVRTLTDPLAIVPAIRQTLLGLDPSLQPLDVRTERQQIADTIDKPRSFAVLTSSVSAVGLLLACVGLYGIVAFSVTHRAREISIRMALGAQRSDVLLLVLRETLTVLAIGTAIGLAVALAVGRLLGSVFFGVTATDPSTIASAVLVLAAVAGLAAYVPARRAVRMEPTETLRYE